jgi:hypothetical protein
LTARVTSGATYHAAEQVDVLREERGPVVEEGGRCRMTCLTTLLMPASWTATWMSESLVSGNCLTGLHASRVLGASCARPRGFSHHRIAPKEAAGGGGGGGDVGGGALLISQLPQCREHDI